MSLPDFSSPRVVIRPALPHDKSDVLEFCKHIWDGHDYIQYVWDEWSADSEGILAVAEYNGHAVGIGKASRPAPGQWWLEGLRVDPNHWGLGIGTKLNDYLIDWWIDHGNGIVRLMTSSQRVKVHHLMDRHGFNKVLDETLFTADALPEPTDAFSLLTMDDIPVAVEFIRRSDSLRMTNGLSDVGWMHIIPDESCLRKSIEEQRVLWWRGGEGLLSYWFDGEGDERVAMLEILACKETDIVALLADYRHLGARPNLNSVAGFLPIDSKLPGLALAAGFRREWENESMYVYEKKHPKRE